MEECFFLPYQEYLFLPPFVPWGLEGGSPLTARRSLFFFFFFFYSDRLRPFDIRLKVHFALDLGSSLFLFNTGRTFSPFFLDVLPQNKYPLSGTPANPSLWGPALKPFPPLRTIFFFYL